MNFYDKIVRRKITNFKNNKLDKYSYHIITKDNFFPMQSILRRNFLPLKTGYFNEFEFLDSSDNDMWLKMALTIKTFNYYMKNFHSLECIKQTLQAKDHLNN